MKKMFSKPLFWFFLILTVLIAIILPILLKVDSVGADPDAKGMFREMSVWFDILVTLLMTFVGFFLAMQFDDFLEAKADERKEDEVWTTSVEQTLDEIKRKCFDEAKVARLIPLCDALLKACEIDSIAVSTVRKSPFYRRLYYVLTELRTLPIEKNDLMFLTLSELLSKKNDNNKKDTIESILIWLICVVLLDSIDLSQHRLFEDAVISKAIKDELDTYFCFESHSNGGVAPSRGSQIFEKINAMSQATDIENYLDETKNKFCAFLQLSAEQKKRCKTKRQKRHQIVENIEKL